MIGASRVLTSGNCCSRPMTVGAMSPTTGMLARKVSNGVCSETRILKVSNVSGLYSAVSSGM